MNFSYVCIFLDLIHTYINPFYWRICYEIKRISLSKTIKPVTINYYWQHVLTCHCYAWKEHVSFKRKISILDKVKTPSPGHLITSNYWNDDASSLSTKLVLNNLDNRSLYPIVASFTSKWSFYLPSHIIRVRLGLLIKVRFFYIKSSSLFSPPSHAGRVNYSYLSSLTLSISNCVFIYYTFRHIFPINIHLLLYYLPLFHFPSTPKPTPLQIYNSILFYLTH